MEELVNWTRKNLDDKFYHPLIVIGIFIVRFLAIHPFQDGNGRLSRVLTGLLLLKSGYEYTPYSSLESIIEDNKEGYYRSLRQTQTTLDKTNDYEPWLLFFLKTLQKQKIRLEHKLDTYNKTDLSLPELSVKILEIFEKQERATVTEIINFTGANSNTVKKHLATLVDQGRLIKYGKTRGAWYVRNL
jgi:Fic family protein